MINYFNSNSIYIKQSRTNIDVFNIFIGRHFLFRLNLSDIVSELQFGKGISKLNISNKRKKYLYLCIILRSYGLIK